MFMLVLCSLQEQNNIRIRGGVMRSFYIYFNIDCLLPSSSGIEFL